MTRTIADIMATQLVTFSPETDIHKAVHVLLEKPITSTVEEAEEIATNIPEYELGDEITWTNSVPYLLDDFGNEAFDFKTNQQDGLDTGVQIAKTRVEKNGGI